MRANTISIRGNVTPEFEVPIDVNAPSPTASKVSGRAIGTAQVRGSRSGPVWLIIMLALGLLAAACTDGADSTEGSLPQDSEFFNADGSAGTLVDYRGQPVVLNFFASWCPPCRAELPEFETVSREVAGEVTFLGVNTDFSEDAWLRMIEETGITFPTVFQPSNELFVATKSPSMPTTLFIDADGAVKHTFAGRLSEDRLRELIVEHLQT